MSDRPIPHHYAALAAYLTTTLAKPLPSPSYPRPADWEPAFAAELTACNSNTWLSKPRVTRMPRRRTRGLLQMRPAAPGDDTGDQLVGDPMTLRKIDLPHPARVVGADGQHLP